MDDNTAFERQVAAELVRRAGPVRPVDDIAVLDAIHSTTDTPTRRFPSMLTALKFAAAGLVFALVGAFLLASVAPDGGEPMPPAAPTEAANEVATISGAVSVLGVPRPSFAARLVVNLIDTQASPDEAVLGRYVYEEPRQPGPMQDVETLPFVLDYPLEVVEADGSYELRAEAMAMDTGEVFATSDIPVPVITDGHPTEDVVVHLVAVPASQIPRLTGVLMAAPDLPDLDAPARLTIRLLAEDEGGADVVLGESVTENIARLRPPREYALDFDLEAIDPAGDYRLETRLEDPQTGEILGSHDAHLDVLEDGGLNVGTTIRIEATADSVD